MRAHITHVHVGADCYKKFEDRGKMHRACLQDHLAVLSAQNEDVAVHSCPRCSKPYRLNVHHAFKCDFSHVCTARAINHAFEFSIVVFTLLCTVFAFFLLDWEELSRDRGSLYLLVGLSVVTFAMVGFTLHRVFHRFKRASSDFSFQGEV